MTNEQLQILDDLMTQGYTTRTISLLDGNLQFTIKNLPIEDQLEVEASMKNIDSTPLYTVHTYSLRLLERALLSVLFKGAKTNFANFQEASEYLAKKPAAIIDLMVAEHGKLEKEISTLVKDEKAVENFSKTPSVE